MTALILTCPLCGAALEVPVTVRSVHPYAKWMNVEFNTSSVDHVCKTPHE